MGNRFVISIDTEIEGEAFAKIDQAFDKIAEIEKMLTTFSESSVTSQVNAAAGERPVKVPREFFDLVHRGKAISELTQGAFDLSYGSVDQKLWNFDKTLSKLPIKEAKENRHLINYKNIILDKKQQTVFLKFNGMRLGFGAIGKGYAADKAAQYLQEMGVKNGIVNAAGDLKPWGMNAGKPWSITIADPENPQTPFGEIETGCLAVATSGSYEKFAMVDGQKVSHTISPTTGLPVSGIKSATVICASAELADAMATAITVLGINDGLSMLNQMKDVGCLIIDEENKIFTTKNISL